MATDRLYYHDSFLYEFDGSVVETLQIEGRPAIVLDRTAFYPTSGGQIHDVGKLLFDGREVPVTDVADDEQGRILHYVAEPIAVDTAIHGLIDESRRLDHVQQHTGQHVLSAAFIELLNMPTISFHMGAETCTIDLQTESISPAQSKKPNVWQTRSSRKTVLSMSGLYLWKKRASLDYESFLQNKQVIFASSTFRILICAPAAARMCAPPARLGASCCAKQKE